jgi:pyrimidine operon attenuation protein/uracil phosphoribosyltransferase
MPGPDLRRAVVRLAHEITETGVDPGDLVLLGIPSRGVPLAARIAVAVADITGRVPAHGSLDITMYRDDLHRAATRAPSTTHVPVPVDERVVVLVDDVLFSGRTVRAAMDALRDIGRPSYVRLAVLVDRGHRRLPIRPDHVGRNLPTSLTQHVRVRMSEIDGTDGVDVLDAPGGAGPPGRPGTRTAADEPSRDGRGGRR